MNTKLGRYCTSADLEDTNESLKTTHDNKAGYLQCKYGSEYILLTALRWT